MQNAWAALDPFNQVGLVPDSGPTSSKSDPTTGIAQVAPMVGASAPAWHPDNGLFVFGLLLAATVGLVAFSTSVKVGPFKGSIGLGGSK